MACCKSLFAALLVIVNVVLAVAGLLMLAFGIAAAIKPESVVEIFSYAPGITEKSMNAGFNVEETIKSSAVFMIILGAVVSAMGLFGCIGACCENKCMLITYIGMLVAILIAEVALIIYASVSPGHLEKTTRPLMLKSLQKYKNDGNAQGNYNYTLPTGETELAWASLQFEAGCCGAHGYADYKNVSFEKAGFTPDNAKIPVSCCKLDGGPGRIATLRTDFKNLDKCLDGNVEFINEKDCYTAVEDLLKKYSKVAIGIAAAIIVIEIILIGLAVYLCRNRMGDAGVGKSRAV
jgi:hypothetical protein